MRAVGLTCGIGSMLVGARQAGFDVIGNVEWRTYYHKGDAEGRNTFKENFKGAFMRKKVEDLTHDDIEKIMGVELAMGHPECGAYSTMNGTNAWRGDNAPKVTDQGDIPLFTRLVAKLKPRYFVMDDLPKSFMAYSMKDYHEALPEYDLFPEWVSNYNYGNIQKHRRRMFMIGSLRTERFAFVPGEFEHNRTVEDEIGDLPVDLAPGYRGNVANHDPHTVEKRCGRGLHMNFVGHRPSWGDMKAWFENARIGETFRYHSPTGTVKNKPGWYKAKWEGPAPVIDGGSGHMHPKRNLPFTIRERARIQGFPDDFIFYGLKREPDGTWCHEDNIDLIKQTGKAMPIQFCRYAAKLVRASILGENLPEATGMRVIPANDLVSEAKQWYCENVGYAAQERACAACWLFSRCTIRSRKYGIGTAGLVGAGHHTPPSGEEAARASSADTPSELAGLVGNREATPKETDAAAALPATASTISPGRPAASPRRRRSAEPVIADVSSALIGRPLKPRGEDPVKPPVDYQTIFKKRISNL